MNLSNDNFDSFNTADTYTRVDETHPLDLFIGVDNQLRWSLLLLSKHEPSSIESSRMILAQKGKRKDKQWTLTLSLQDSSYKDIFLLLCRDIIESSKSFSNKKNAVKFISERYSEWREMLANPRSSLLSVNEIKGLLGEMFFSLTFLVPKYGIVKAVQSWTGPRSLPQDFVIDNTWYEVKTISSVSSEVKISSVEQLDSSSSGELVVVYADKTSCTSENALNINSIYARLLEMIADDSIKAEFIKMLFLFGYYNRCEYEMSEYTFEIKKMSRYNVDAAFPCLRRANMPLSVNKVEYSISLPAINNFQNQKE